MTFNKLTDKSMWLPYKKCFSYVRSLNVILKSNEYNNSVLHGKQKGVGVKYW